MSFRIAWTTIVTGYIAKQIAHKRGVKCRTVCTTSDPIRPVGRHHLDNLNNSRDAPPPPHPVPPETRASASILRPD